MRTLYKLYLLLKKVSLCTLNFCHTKLFECMLASFCKRKKIKIVNTTRPTKHITNRTLTIDNPTVLVEELTIEI